MIPSLRRLAELGLITTLKKKHCSVGIFTLGKTDGLLRTIFDCGPFCELCCETPASALVAVSAVGTAGRCRLPRSRGTALGPGDPSADLLSDSRSKTATLPAGEMSQRIETNADLLKQLSSETSTDLQAEIRLRKDTGHREHQTIGHHC